MVNKYYSREQELTKPASGLIAGDIPKGVRNALAIKFSHPAYGNLSDMWRWVMSELDWEPALLHSGPTAVSNPRNRDALLKAVAERPYAEWLDLVSSLFYYATTRTVLPFESASTFRDFLNERLMRHYSAYLMAEDGCMEELGGGVVEQSIADARSILTAPRLSGPDRQFQDAVLAFHKRPNPNLEHAVSLALNAVEGVTKIVLGEDHVTLGQGLKRVMEKHQMHGAIVAAVSALYGYASQDGGRHSVVGASKVTEPIAEYCLHQAAAAIVLIARLEGWAVVEGTTVAA